MALFTPALLFSKVAFTLTPDKLKELLIIPIGFTLVTCLSAIVGYILSSVFRLKKPQRNFASESRTHSAGSSRSHPLNSRSRSTVACAMFQNSNSLPIALMQSLISEKMPLKWSSDDTKDSMLGRALSYLVLFSTLGIIVRWSIGVKLLTSGDDKPNVDEEDSATDDDGEERSDEGETSPLLNGDVSVRPDMNQASVQSASDHRTVQSITHADTILSNPSHLETVKGVSPYMRSRNKLSNKKRPQSIFQSFPNTPIPSRGVSVHEAASDDEGAGHDAEWGHMARGGGRREQDGPETAMGEKWTSAKLKIKKVCKTVKRIAKRINAFVSCIKV